jgi:hypothetical protein
LPGASVPHEKEDEMTNWSREEATKFVRALFEHVSRDDAPKDEWVEAWTDRALKLGTVEKAFFTFIGAPSHQKRMADERRSEEHTSNSSHKHW